MLKIGLALGSGGPKGLAHIGVLKVLEENNIPIDFIAGSSIGSMVGGFYAARKSALEIEKIALDMSKIKTISLFFHPSLKNRFSADQEVIDFIEEKIGKINFDKLKIPFSAVTTNLKTNRIYVINKGNVAKAIKASCSIPYVFKPTDYDEQSLVDGGLTMPVPVQIVKKMGADIIIAVNLYYDVCNTQTSNFPRATLIPLILLNSLSEENCKNANVIINPKIGHINWKTLLSKKEKIAGIKIGEDAMHEKIPQLKKLLGLKKENIFDKIKNFFVENKLIYFK